MSHVTGSIGAGRHSCKHVDTHTMYHFHTEAGNLLN